VRSRITVVDDSFGLRHDMVVECANTDPVSVALDAIARALPLSGAPQIDGVLLDPSAPAALSALCDGVVLRYGAGAPGIDHVARTGHVVRVVSGPNAGAQIALPAGQQIDVGRSAAAQLVLNDPDVSRLHATFHESGGVWAIVDRGSSNGTLVDGQPIAGSRVLRDGEVVQVGGSRLVVEEIGRAIATLERAPDGAFLLNRRFPDRRASYDAPTVRLPSPVAEDDDPRGIPVIAMLLPLVMAGVLALIMHSPSYLTFGLLSPVMLAGSWWTDRRRRAARELRQDRKYGDKLRVARADIEAALADEDADLRQRWSDPETVTRVALAPRVELWSRRPGQDDWLDVRLGTADRSASVRVEGEKPSNWTEPMLEGAPVGVDLEQMGVLGLAGPTSWLRARLAWVLTQCAVWHSPGELRVVVLAPDVAEEDLGWIRWLPHVRDDSGTVLAAWDDQGVDALLRFLGADLDRRAEAIRNNREALPGQVLVVLAGSGALSRRPAVVEMLNRGPDLGLRFVCTDADDRLLPDRCRAVLVGDDRASELRIDRGGLIRLTPDTHTYETTERIARRLAPLRRVGDSPAGGLPDAIRFTDLAGLPSADEVRESWRLCPERTEVAIGRDSDGASVLDIARDGPHAIVAGTSGAGKSELLQTWIAALALANTPEQLSIVFMDYKGGSAFKDLVPLPHVVGSVTNLDERLAARALASLGAELRRRQEQLAFASAGDRPDYLKRASLDPSLPPFPRLLIVVDELAEMKEHLSSLVDGLVGVARIGRSLGVHLVLATQKPGGVVDSQIRANADLRICLRTRDAGESMDVIEVGGAADIPKDRPGRALIVRGGAPARLVQTARITTPRTAEDHVVRRAVPVRWNDLAAPPPATAEDEGLRTDLNVLAETICEAAAEEGLVAPYRPWTDPLPPVVTLSALGFEPGALPLGLRDRPSLQRQEPLWLPLGTGHLAIVGSGRTGRTCALRAIAAGLAGAGSPDKVHIHVIDGAGGLAGLTMLPQVGVVASEDDPERLERLLNRLVDLVRARRRELSAKGASSTEELGSQGLPAPAQVVLLVDGWSGTTEGIESGAPAALQELLSGGSAAAGVTVCLAGDERLMKSRVLGRIDHRLCLRLNNASDATLLGLDSRNLPIGLPPGRGLWAEDGTEVQLPLLSADPVGVAQASALALLADELRERYGTAGGPHWPLRLDPLPARIGLAAATALGPAPTGAQSVMLGVSGDRLAPVWVDLDGLNGHIVIAGPSRSGRSTAAVSVAVSAASCGSRVVLVAPRVGAAHGAAANDRIVVVKPAALPAALDDSVTLVVVDDADTIDWNDDLLARLTGPGGPSLVVAAQIDAFGFGARGLVAAVRKSISSVVLLSPPSNLVADYVDVKIDRTMAFTGPPGRAFLSHHGELMLGQVPDITAPG
jgi:S-DNA-T family DNA segregation ATPase FtsK/SpoIIIE